MLVFVTRGVHSQSTRQRTVMPEFLRCVQVLKMGLLMYRLFSRVSLDNQEKDRRIKEPQAGSNATANSDAVQDLLELTNRVRNFLSSYSIGDRFTLKNPLTIALGKRRVVEEGVPAIPKSKRKRRYKDVEESFKGSDDGAPLYL